MAAEDGAPARWGEGVAGDAGQSRRDVMHFAVVRQGVDEVKDVESAPGVSMGVYLERMGEMERFRRISVYQERGKTREQARTLYMNHEALAVWRAMGREPEVVGERYRPPQTAELAFGVPFSE